VSEIKFTKEEKEILAKKIQMYLSEKLDKKIGQFDAHFLLDFFSDEIGVYFYNRGLYDAQSILEARMDSISEAIYDMEKITEFRK